MHFIISGLVQIHNYMDSVLHTNTNIGAATQKDLALLYSTIFLRIIRKKNFFLSLHYLLSTVVSILVTKYTCH